MNTFGFKDKFEDASKNVSVDTENLIKDVYFNNDVKKVVDSSIDSLVVDNYDSAHQVVIAKNVPLFERGRSLSWSFCNFLSALVKYGVPETDASVGIPSSNNEKYNGLVLAESLLSEKAGSVRLLVSGVYKEDDSFFGDLAFVSSSPINGSVKGAFSSQKKFAEYARENLVTKDSSVVVSKFLKSNYN